jgi:methylglyoxal/glyoxal reductase
LQQQQILDSDSKDPQNRARRLAAWRVFERYYEMGWIRAIGVSNWTEHHLTQLMDDGAKYKPMVNQIEGNIYLQWHDIVKYCQTNDIVVEAFSPLGHGGAMLKDSAVSSIAQKHNKDVGQVAMRYLIEKGYAVTFSTTSEKRLVTNQQIFDFQLDDDDMKQLDALNGTAESTGQPTPYDMS